MNMKTIAAAALAVCSASAFAAVTPSCPATVTTVTDLVTKCAPEIVVKGAGATAPKASIQAVLTTDGKVFDKSKPFASITLSGNTDQYAYYGFGAAGTSFAGKKVAVIYNGKNGSIAGVAQLLSGLKTGSTSPTGVDQKEFLGVMQLHTAAEEKAGTAMPATAYVSINDATGAVVLASTRVADFKTAWGKDKQKVAHFAISDVRPNEGTPGQIKKWTPASFPSTTVLMQGFGVVVNNNLYNALMARDVAAGRLPSTCVAGTYTAACQPNIYSPEYLGLMLGNITTADQLLGTTGDTKKIKLQRRVAGSGTQASTQIYFSMQAGYNAKLVDKATTKSTDNSVTDDILGGDDAVVETRGDLTVTSHSGTTGLLNALVAATDDYALGVVSLENGPSKFGSPQTVRLVKLDGISPDANADASGFDSKQRTGMQKGYRFAFELQALKSAKITGAYLDIYNLIEAGLKDPAANLTGMAYIGSTDAAKNTVWTHGGNNNYPLSKY